MVWLSGAVKSRVCSVRVRARLNYGSHDDCHDLFYYQGVDYFYHEGELSAYGENGYYV